MPKGGGRAGPALTVKCRSGDNLMLADADGLLCVPFDSIEAVLAATRQKMEDEKKTLVDIATARLDTSWIGATLTRIGCNSQPR